MEFNTMEHRCGTAQAAENRLAPNGRARGLYPGVFKELTAADLPGLMAVDCSRGPYRVPLAQFVVDWNRSTDPAAMIAAEPSYHGNDASLMPTIAVVVHALCDRDAIAVPEWVLEHRADQDLILFAWDPGSDYGRWIRQRSLPVSEFHRVYFHPQLLDKGTPRQWNPITD